MAAPPSTPRSRGPTPSRPARTSRTGSMRRMRLVRPDIRLWLTRLSMTGPALLPTASESPSSSCRCRCARSPRPPSSHPFRRWPAADGTEVARVPRTPEVDGPWGDEHRCGSPTLLGGQRPDRQTRRPCGWPNWGRPGGARGRAPRATPGLSTSVNPLTRETQTGAAGTQAAPASPRAEQAQREPARTDCSRALATSGHPRRTRLENPGPALAWAISGSCRGLRSRLVDGGKTWLWKRPNVRSRATWTAC